MWALDAESEFLWNPFTKRRSYRLSTGKSEANGWVKLSGVGAFSYKSSVVMSVSVQELGSQEGSVFWRPAAIMGNNAITWAGRCNACLLVYLGMMHLNE
jgi:hypothetical protein